MSTKSESLHALKIKFGYDNASAEPVKIFCQYLNKLFSFVRVFCLVSSIPRTGPDLHVIIIICKYSNAVA